MKISVLLDSNAWNFFHERLIDLSEVLPPEDFSFFITPELRAELDAIPDEGKDGIDKRPLKQYIRASIYRNKVTTTGTFGFAEANPANGPATIVGFGQGTFQSNLERDWYGESEIKSYLIGKPVRKSGLTNNQADVAVSAASFSCIVLSCDKKKGPIQKAAISGGKVVFLSDDLLARQPLRLHLHTVANG